MKLESETSVVLRATKLSNKQAKYESSSFERPVMRKKIAKLKNEVDISEPSAFEGAQKEKTS